MKRNLNVIALLMLFGVSGVSLFPELAVAERVGSFFGRRPSSSNIGGVGSFSGRDAVQGFATLIPNGRGQFNIAANGRLGVDGRDQFGREFALFLDSFGNLTDAFGIPINQRDPRIANEFAAFAGQNRDQFNRRNRIDRFVARNTGNIGALNGVFVFDLNSWAPGALVEDEFKDTPGEINRPCRGAATVQQLPKKCQFALATLNMFLNNISRGRTLLRVGPQNIRADGSIALNLGPFMSRDALILLAQSDPTSRCTGKLRINSAIQGLMGDPNNYYQALGLKGLNRDQIYRLLGVEDDNTETIRNKIFVDQPLGQVRFNNGQRSFSYNNRESGVSTGGNRVLKFLNMNNVPGGTCYESDDFFERNAPGVNTDARNPTRVGIFYSVDAREVLCHKQNGYIFGMLFNNAGVLQTTAPSDIAGGGSTTGFHKTVSAGVSCMECHSRGLIAGGYKVGVQGIHSRDLYQENLGRIPNIPTVFRDAFGNRLTHRDFFTDNRNYRIRANRDSRIFFNALIASGAFIPGTSKTPDYERFPLPLVSSSLDRGFRSMDVEDRARELGISVAQATALTGAGAVDRPNFDTAFCALRAAAGGSVLGDQAQRRIGGSVRTSLPSSGLPLGSQHLFR